MKNYHYEWWTVDVAEATGKMTWEIKAKTKEGAIRQIKKSAAKHTEQVQRFRPDFKTVIYWETLKLDRIGYQRLS